MEKLKQVLGEALYKKVFDYDISKISEIRINRRGICVLKDGELIDLKEEVTKTRLFEIVNLICDGGIYSKQESISNGFVTIKGGHRAGFCGQAVKKDGKIIHISPINAICIRVAHQIEGASQKIMSEIYDGKRVNNTLIISPPGKGKTTMLRDIAKNLGDKMKVAIMDERGEISAFYDGNSLFDVGKYTVVLFGASKYDGIQMLLRTMSPDVIITDEIGEGGDEIAIDSMINQGVKIICSAHGYSLSDLERRKVLGKIINQKIFKRYIILGEKAGAVEEIIRK